MATRTELRENTFMLLFRAEFHALEDMPEQMVLYFETIGMELSEKDKAYVHTRVDQVMECTAELDKAIDQASEKWEVSRIDKVTLTILRLAAYEMKYDETIPEKVSIDEALNLAKKYGPDDSAGFVNGILGKFVTE